MSRSSRRQHARKQRKAGHLDQAEFRFRMASYKRLKRLPGYAFTARQGDMRMKRFEIRFETRMEDGILDTPMQRKKMWMPVSHTRPDDRRPPVRIEETDAAQRQKKRRHPHVTQGLLQPILRRRLYVADEAERQVKLLLGKPAETGQMRVERDQRHLATRRELEADEEPFGRQHPKE
jgi:hypothetical protein